MLNVLVKDNEKNASKCLSIILLLHKDFKQHIHSHVAPFLEFFKSLYRQFSTTVMHVFSVSRQTNAEIPIQRSITSFRLLIETPLVVLNILKIHPSFLETHLSEISQLILWSLKISAPRHDQESLELSTQLFTAQVKVTSLDCFVSLFLANLYKTVIILFSLFSQLSFICECESSNQ